MTTPTAGRDRRMRSAAVALVVVACVLAAAHVLRADRPIVAVLALAAPSLLLVRRAWAPRVLQLALFAATLEWGRTTVALVHGRMVLGVPWRRMAAILVGVAAVTLWAAVLAPRASRTLPHPPERP